MRGRVWAQAGRNYGGSIYLAVALDAAGWHLIYRGLSRLRRFGAGAGKIRTWAVPEAPAQTRFRSRLRQIKTGTVPYHAGRSSSHVETGWGCPKTLVAYL